MTQRPTSDVEHYEFPVSFAQQRLWFLDQLEGSSAAYNIKLPVQLTGPLNTKALQAAIDHVVARHESLRTSFAVRLGEPVQVIASVAEVALQFHDLPGAGTEEVARTVGDLATQPFALDTSPLLRVHLLRLDADDHLLLMVMHHIVGDAWSSGVLFQDLAGAYDAIAHDQAPALAELAVQYADFSVWQREWLAGTELEGQADYWRAQLAGAPGLLEWPADRPRRRHQTYNGSRMTRVLEPDLNAALKALAQSQSCTLFMVMLAAFDVLMARYTGSDDVVIGTPVAGRRRTELEGLVGLFVNTLVMRADVTGNPSFTELLRQVRAVALDAFSNQDLPFEKLVELMQPTRDTGHAPLFQTMFALQNTPWAAQPIRGMTVSPGETSPGETAKFDLTLAANEFEDALWLNFEYNTDLFDRVTIERIGGAYETLLRAIVEDPAIAVHSLPMWGDDDRQRDFDTWNATTVEFDAQTSVDHVIGEQIRRTPAATAIECGAYSWSYADLDAHINACAAALAAVLPDREKSVVAILIERGPAMTAAVLGASRAGAAWLPLDSRYPAERLRHMLDDSGAAAMIVSVALADGVEAFDGFVIVVDDDGRIVERRGSARAGGVSVDDDIAYLIYTSGSTGVPKGVCVPHDALLNFLDSMRREPGISADDRLLAITTLSFDISILELLLPLTVGATSIIAPEAVTTDGYELANLIAAAEPTIMQATPASWRMLLNAGWAGSEKLKVLCGGEPLDRSLAARLLSRCHEVWNMYGPTETTIWSTCGRIDSAAATPTVGRPIANTRVHVLDVNRRLVPVGVAGELYIAGDGVARGYHRRPELTAEQFVTDPFAPGGRLYRTGDRARWRSDGTLELLGRADRQIKLRGFRIELGEIETALEALPEISAAAVVVHERSGGDKRLVAYAVPAAGVAPIFAEIRQALRQRLPDYMVPAMLVELGALPLTPNGKVDRRALPAPDWTTVGDPGGVAARDATEAALASLFAEVLDCSTVGVHDDFFDRGGHSLLATRLVARIRDAFSIELPLRLLFDEPTVAGLAAAIRSDATDRAAQDFPVRDLAGSRMRPTPRADKYRTEAPASFMQQRLWFLDQLQPGNPVYHLVWSMRIRGELQIPALEQAVASVVQRHESLRTIFVTRDGAPFQRIVSDMTVPVVIESLAGTVATSGKTAEQRVKTIAMRPFDLSSGPLLRVNVLQLGAGEYVLALVIHHIVADGWSMSVLYRELASAYAAHCTDQERALPALAVQYADYALWQRRWLSAAEQERQLSYWRDQLAGAPAQLALPTDRPRPPVQVHRGARLTQRIPASIVRAVGDLSRDSGCTLFMTLLAAFDAVLARFSGQADIVIGTPVAGRGHTELEGLIGFFINTLALRVDLEGDPRFDELLLRARQVALDAYAHQDIPFERIVDELRLERDSGRTPLFQVMFNLHNEPLESMRLHELELVPFGVDRGTSKFDLSVSLNETERGLTLQLEYDTDLFDAETIAGLGEYYRQVLEAVSATPSLRLSQLPAANGVAPAVAAAHPLTPASAITDDLVGAFESVAAAAPKRLAVCTSAHRLSYGALDGQANDVARQLLAAGLAAGLAVALADDGQDDAYAPRVGLMAAQDAPLVIGMLGILKSGGAYVPLEPWQPAARLDAIAASAKLTAIVCDSAHADTARACFGSLPVIVCDNLIEATPSPQVHSDPQALAYILYTSGTTGEPKGVMQTRGGATAQIRRYIASLGLSADDRLSGLSGYGYDAAVQDIFGALLTGARLYPLDVRGNADTGALVQVLGKAQVTVVHATPTVYRHLFGGELNCSHDLSAMRLVVLGGEVVRRSDFELYRSRFARGTLFVNGYGLTESTMGLQCFADHDARLLGQQLPLGQAVGDLEVELFDAVGNVSWQGEIRLRGVGVFAGYWNASNRDSAVTADGWYCTGDLGRRLPDGQILYMGRRDGRLKIRGQRVEPAEIEAALNALPEIQESAVHQVEHAGGESLLVAYVVTAARVSAEQFDSWRSALARVLPAHMVPQAFEALSTLPRRSNGKVAMDSLPTPGATVEARAAVPPRTELETVLTELWREVLPVEAIGVHDDFFALGGHSLLATRLISRIRDRLAIEVPLVALFEGPTIAKLADAIEAGGTLTPAIMAASGRGEAYRATRRD